MDARGEEDVRPRGDLVQRLLGQVTHVRRHRQNLHLIVIQRPAQRLSTKKNVNEDNSISFPCLRLGLGVGKGLGCGVGEGVVNDKWSYMSSPLMSMFPGKRGLTCGSKCRWCRCSSPSDRAAP